VIFLDNKPNPFGWFSPDISQLPGGGTFRDLTNGLGGYVLEALVFGLVLAAGSWAVGVGTGNIGLAERGKQGVIVAALIALLVGGSAVILGFFYGTGQGLH
jgi:Family of unknown function (DUF6112)